MEPVPPSLPADQAICRSHPESAATDACVRCGTYVCSMCTSVYDGHCEACADYARGEPILLEQDPLPMGWPSALFRTIGQLLTAPAQAFQAKSTYALERPVIFAACMIAFNLGVEAVWALVVQEDAWEAVILLGMAVGMPIIVLVQGLFSHGCLWLLGGLNGAPLKATLRVHCYSTAPLLFSFAFLELPASIWSLVILVVGLRETHGCGTFKAIVAPLLPACLMVVGIIAIFAGLDLSISDFF